MKPVYKLSWALILLASAAFAQTPAPPAALPSTRPVLTPREIAQRTLPSVVLLVIETGRGERVKYGSGFFVTPDTVVTNFHVLEDAVNGIIKSVGQKTTYEILGAVGVDVDNDLALVKVKGARMPSLAVGNSSALVIGDEIFAVGNPKGLEGTFSQGIVSSIRREGKDSVIQITAPISPGSSGGPVLNTQGEVIGVAVGGITSGQALNFAIPSSLFKIYGYQSEAADVAADQRAGRAPLAGGAIPARLRGYGARRSAANRSATTAEPPREPAPEQREHGHQPRHFFSRQKGVADLTQTDGRSQGETHGIHAQSRRLHV
jgi:hypothetical protein